jgi:gamma-glutamylcyclotransferase (GGCT)/AIG2-like uncharacterized protein YtfP
VNLFAYGTLQCPELLRAVAGVELPAEEAVLPGHRRERVAGAAYPGIVPDAATQVPGRLYRNFPRRLVPFLDAFEGAEYRRRILPVRAADGRTVPALVYRLEARTARRLEGAPWDLATFRRRHLEGYLVRCRRLHRSLRLGRDVGRLA